MSFGTTELLILLVIVLLVLGPKRLPSLGRQLGGGFRELRDSITGGDRAGSQDDSESPARVNTRPGDELAGGPDARPKADMAGGATPATPDGGSAGDGRRS